MPSGRKPSGTGERTKKPATARVGSVKKPARRPAARTARSEESSTAGASSIPETTAPTTSAVRRPKPAGGKTITILQYVSGIACPVRQKRVLRALGLRHPHHRVVRPDNPAVRGMVLAIPHLVRIVEDERGA